METYDDGIVYVCNLSDQAEKGNMPKPVLVTYKRFYFQDMSVSFTRQYAAKGVNELIDRLVRIWADKTVRIGMYAVIGEEQYRISNCQQLLNNDGLKVTDLTLVRLGEHYDFDSTVNSNSGCPYTVNG